LRSGGVHYDKMESIGGIFFKDLRDTCVFNDLDPIQCKNLKFCFMDLIQTELDRIALEIRQQTSSSVICGKPDTLFFCTRSVWNSQLRQCSLLERRKYLQKRQCEKFVELAPLLKPDLQMPLDAVSILQLCTELNDLILRIDLI
jgi:hypothetical protein